MRFDIELPWAEMKAQVLDTGNWKWIHFDINDHYMVYANQNDFTVLCKLHKDSGADQVDFETNYSTQHKFKNEVVTEFELDDKVLKLAHTKGTVVDGIATMELEVPGTVGTVGRHIAGGYCISDKYGWDDRIKVVEVVDKNFLYAGGLYPATPLEAGIEGTEGLSWADIMPTGVVLETYHDNDVPEANAGWSFWAGERVGDFNEGDCEVEPIGGFGKIPAKTFLRAVFEAGAGSPATKCKIVYWWGKQA